MPQEINYACALFSQNLKVCHRGARNAPEIRYQFRHFQRFRDFIVGLRCPPNGSGPHQVVKKGTERGRKFFSPQGRVPPKLKKFPKLGCLKKSIFFRPPKHDFSTLKTTGSIFRKKNFNENLGLRNFSPKKISQILQVPTLKTVFSKTFFLCVSDDFPHENFFSGVTYFRTPRPDPPQK